MLWDLMIDPPFEVNNTQFLQSLNQLIKRIVGKPRPSIPFYFPRPHPPPPPIPRTSCLALLRSRP